MRHLFKCVCVDYAISKRVYESPMSFLPFLDDNIDRPTENSSLASTRTGCTKDRPLFGVWRCSSSPSDGYLCSNWPLACLHLVITTLKCYFPLYFDTVSACY